MSCREYGHLISNCTRDPNLKTVAMAQYENDMQRIVKLKDFRKLYADTAVQTTRMLKKTVMIPIKHDDEGKVHE